MLKSPVKGRHLNLKGSIQVRVLPVTENLASHSNRYSLHTIIDITSALPLAQLLKYATALPPSLRNLISLRKFGQS